MFGLDDSLNLVRMAAASPEYSKVPYGVPLSLDERLELIRRAHIELDSQAASALGRAQPTWGGYYFDQLDRGAPVFLFTAGAEQMRPRLAERLPAGTAFRVEAVERTLSELTTTKSAISQAIIELRAAGIPISGVGLDISANLVRVEVEGLTDEYARAITDRFGESLRFEDSPVAHSDACPTSNCRPMKGGIRIVGGVTGLPCTAGFIVRRQGSSTTLALLTAGHCLWQEDPPPVSTRFYHRNSSNQMDYFGTALNHTFANGSNGDVGIVTLDSAERDQINNATAANVMYARPIGLSSTHRVTGYVFDDYQTQGSQACAYGSQSDEAACTTVTDPDADKISRADAVWDNKPEQFFTIHHTKVYNYNLIGGDSGGPIFKLLDQYASNVLALGTHVHSLDNNTFAEPILGEPGWYTPYFEGVVAYNAISPGNDTYALCTSGTC